MKTHDAAARAARKICFERMDKDESEIEPTAATIRREFAADKAVMDKLAEACKVLASMYSADEPPVIASDGVTVSTMVLCGDIRRAREALAAKLKLDDARKSEQ